MNSVSTGEGQDRIVGLVWKLVLNDNKLPAHQRQGARIAYKRCSDENLEPGSNRDHDDLADGGESEDGEGGERVLQRPGMGFIQKLFKNYRFEKIDCTGYLILIISTKEPKKKLSAREWKWGLYCHTNNTWIKLFRQLFREFHRLSVIIFQKVVKLDP